MVTRPPLPDPSAAKRERPVTNATLSQILRLTSVLAALLSYSPECLGQRSATVRTLGTLVEESLDAAARQSGKEFGPAARAAARAELEKAALKHGEAALAAARKGGIELTHAATKYGDEVWTYATRVPGGARPLALHADELVPAVRRYGTGVLEIEAKRPGLSTQLIREFGEEGVNHFTKSTDIGDATRVLGYAARANSLEAKDLLLKCYKEQGSRFLQKLDWKHIAAAGLSVAAITAAHQTSDGVQTMLTSVGEGARDVASQNPHVFSEMFEHITDRASSPIVWPLMLLGCGTALILLLKLWKTLRPTGPRDEKPASGTPRP